MDYYEPFLIRSIKCKYKPNARLKTKYILKAIIHVILIDQDVMNVRSLGGIQMMMTIKARPTK